MTHRRSARKTQSRIRESPVILRAEGARLFVSAAGLAFRGGDGSAPRIGRLSVQGSKGCELALEVVEIVWVGWALAELLDDRREVVHGAHRLERLCVWGAEEPPAGCEGEGRLDEGEGDAARMELLGQATVGTPDLAEGARQLAVLVEDIPDVEIAPSWIRHGGACRLSPAGPAGRAP